MKKKIICLSLVFAILLCTVCYKPQVYAATNAGDNMIGQICLFPYPSRVPIDWLVCDGRTLSIAAYPELFAVIGTTFGGDGSTNFALPNLTSANPYSSPSEYTPRYFIYTAASVDSADYSPNYGTTTLVGEVCLLPDTVAQVANENGACWLKCDGSSYNTSAYSTLHSLISSKFGSNVPDLSSASPLAGLSYYIAGFGLYPTEANGLDELIGSIDLYAFSSSMNGMVQCNGQTLLIQQYQGFFSLLGGNYGGNSITTFGVPDLRGASPLPGLTYYINSMGYYPYFE